MISDSHEPVGGDHSLPLVAPSDLRTLPFLAGAGESSSWDAARLPLPLAADVVGFLADDLLAGCGVPPTLMWYALRASSAPVLGVATRS